MLYGYRIIFSLIVLLIGYTVGRRIGIREGIKRGISISPLSLKYEIYCGESCPICKQKWNTNNKSKR